MKSSDRSFALLFTRSWFLVFICLRWLLSIFVVVTLQKLFDRHLCFFLQQLCFFVVQRLLRFVVRCSDLFVFAFIIGQFVQHALHFRVQQKRIELQKPFGQGLAQSSLSIRVEFLQKGGKIPRTVNGDLRAAVSVVNGEERRLIVEMENGIVSILERLEISQIDEGERKDLLLETFASLALN